MNWNTLAPVVVPLVVAALGSVLTWAAVHLGTYLKAKATALGVQWAYDLLSATASSLVAHTKAELAPKMTSLLSDGSLSAADLALLKATVLQVMKETLGDQWGTIKKALGVSSDGALDSILSGIVTKVLNATTPTNPLLAPAADPVAAKIGQAAAALTAAGMSPGTSLKVTPTVVPPKSF